MSTTAFKNAAKSRRRAHRERHQVTVEVVPEYARHTSTVWGPLPQTILSDYSFAAILMGFVTASPSSEAWSPREAQGLRDSCPVNKFKMADILSRGISSILILCCQGLPP